jgi:periplasmic divalent cation tolerance protein
MGSDSGGGAEARVVLMTAPDLQSAEAIARALVERRLAACVNLVPGVRSIYRWKGAIEDASEVLLVAKTVAGRLGALQEALGELHSYEVPEMVALEAERVAPRYLEWLRAETSGAGAREP